MSNDMPGLRWRAKAGFPKVCLKICVFLMPRVLETPTKRVRKIRFRTHGEIRRGNATAKGIFPQRIPPIKNMYFLYTKHYFSGLWGNAFEFGN